MRLLKGMTWKQITKKLRDNTGPNQNQDLQQQCPQCPLAWTSVASKKNWKSSKPNAFDVSERRAAQKTRDVYKIGDHKKTCWRWLGHVLRMPPPRPFNHCPGLLFDGHPRENETQADQRRPGPGAWRRTFLKDLKAGGLTWQSQMEVPWNHLNY